MPIRYRPRRLLTWRSAMAVCSWVKSLNAQNAPQSGVRVSLQDMRNQEVVAVVTDRQGGFAIQGVPGGTYQLVSPQGRQVYRMWSPGMAPPSAQQGVLMVTPGPAVRGQLGDGSFLGSPALIGGVIGAGVATAIAVPVTYGVMKQPSSP